jgi:hypothetical protein
MEEVGVNGQWGVFSMKIPGRVGYQCSNYYRQLIEQGKIKDENYVIDEKGKARFLFKGKRKPGEEDKESSIYNLIFISSYYYRRSNYKAKIFKTRKKEKA